MREILFRGKLITDGSWSYGNLVVKHNNISIITPDDTPLGRYGQVIPETVGQYTGLTDKNGKKIFEGDILEFTDDDGDKTPYEIYWDESSYAWYIRDDNGCIDDCTPWLKEYFEVIGNIHENPELLEVSK